MFRDGDFLFMKKVAFVFLSFCLFPYCAGAFGLTADQMYRNLLTDENEGVLPAYYTRSAKKQARLDFKRVESVSEKVWTEKHGELPDPIDTNIFETCDTEIWQEIVKAVKNGQTTPFDLETIRRRTQADDAEAVELLAWMYATGKGVRQDLTKSWTYYLQAAHLGVPSATDNARAVYKAMNAAQRASLPAI